MLTRYLIPHRGQRNRSLLWGHFNPFVSIGQDLDRLFEDFTRGLEQPRQAGPAADVDYVPHVDIVDGEKHIEVTADLPGLAEKDIDVSFDDNVLTIKGVKKQASETNGKNYYRMERSYGTFRRDIALPTESLDTEQAKATFKNGVLRITLPKREQESTLKKIPVKADSTRGGSTPPRLPLASAKSCFCRLAH